MEDYFDNINIVNAGINQIVKDMFDFADTNSCGVCGGICLDPEYSTHLICSARCSQKASDQEDEYQQDERD